MVTLLEEAAKLAASCNNKKSYYMACISKRSDGAIVSSVNHGVFGQKIPCHHAEARVLRKSNMGSILYVARVLKDRVTWAHAKPCAYCQKLIKLHV